MTTKTDRAARDSARKGAALALALRDLAIDAVEDGEPCEAEGAAAASAVAAASAEGFVLLAGGLTAAASDYANVAREAARVANAALADLEDGECQEGGQLARLRVWLYAPPGTPAPRVCAGGCGAAAVDGKASCGRVECGRVAVALGPRGCEDELLSLHDDVERITVGGIPPEGTRGRVVAVSVEGVGVVGQVVEIGVECAGVTHRGPAGYWRKLYRCAGPACQGYSWKASERPHPAACAVGER